MMAPAAFGRARSCRFVHTETARAKPMHSKGLWRPDSEEFSAHPEPSRTPAAHARGRPASSRLLCERLDRILAGVHTIEEVTEGDEVMEKRGRQDGITTEQAKGRTQRWQPLLLNLQRVNEAARNSGQTRFTALLHHVDVAALERAFRRQRRAASPGMDRVTVDDYARELEANLRRLHDSVDSGQYWPKPVRRTYIPKADGGRRPLGIPALEDKIVQGAVAEVLNAVYEADFMGFSYGFRPERSPHAALAALDKAW